MKTKEPTHFVRYTSKLSWRAAVEFEGSFSACKKYVYSEVDDDHDCISLGHFEIVEIETNKTVYQVPRWPTDTL